VNKILRVIVPGAQQRMIVPLLQEHGLQQCGFSGSCGAVNPEGIVNLAGLDSDSGRGGKGEAIAAQRKQARE
jgi:hypothetical protein